MTCGLRDPPLSVHTFLLDFKVPESVLVVIYQKNRGFLLLRRKDNGLWQSVTGSRQREEDLAQTAARELEEETGLRALQGNLTYTGRTHTYPIIEPWRSRYAPEVTHNTESVFHFILPADSTPRIRLHMDEHSEFQWLPAQEAAALVFSRTNRAEIERFTISDLDKS